MKERPILFSGPMVRAILEGRKTQTRRVVKLPLKDPLTGCEIAGCEINSMLRQGEEICKYGVPGDRLWVRETFQENTPPSGWIYRADDIAGHIDGGWKPSIFMPRQASRITLEIEAVRVDRINEITREDCIAEGITQRASNGAYTHGGEHALGWAEPEGAYRQLWESINGAGSWDANP